jgi:hypothetical protein
MGIARNCNPRARSLVRSSGFEPPRYCYRQPLKLVRLPIPPRPHSEEDERKYIRRRGILGAGFHSCVTPLRAGSGAQFFGTGENPWDVFPMHVSKMKFAGKPDTVRLVDDFGFGDGEKLVEHAIYGEIACARLMDQAGDGRDVE